MLVLKMEGMNHEPKNESWLIDFGEGKEINFLLEPPERNRALPTP